MPQPTSDYSKLIASLRQGHDFAYNQIIDTFYRELCLYATQLSRDAYRSEDIVQNVIIRLWEKRKSLHPNLNLKSYLYRSVYNEFVDQYRKEMATTALEKKYLEELDRYMETDQEKMEDLIRLVRNEIEQLPDKCKETFLLSRSEGLTYGEIATYMNVSVKTVETQMTKAFSLLRKTLGEKMNGLLFLLFGTNSYKSAH